MAKSISRSAGKTAKQNLAKRFRYADIPSVEVRYELFADGIDLLSIELHHDGDDCNMSLQEARRFSTMLAQQLAIARIIGKGGTA